MAATHAPISILPSRAMLNIPLRSDRMPAIARHRDRGGELEAAARNVRQDRRLAGQERPRAARRSTGQISDEQPAAASGRPAPRTSCRHADERRRDAGDDPQHADRRRDRGALAALLVDPERELGGDVEAAAREVEREERRTTPKASAADARALRSALRAARPSPVGADGGVAAVMRAPPLGGPARSRAAGWIDLDSPDRRG